MSRGSQLSQTAFRFLPVPRTREEGTGECQQLRGAAIFECFVAGSQGTLGVPEILQSADPGNPRSKGTRRGVGPANTHLEPGQALFFPSEGAKGNLIGTPMVFVMVLQAGC